MCRLIAYLGPARPIGEVMLEPPHGLVQQSYAPREMTDGMLNADGWGVGWFGLTDGTRAGVLKGLLPIWSDPNARSSLDVIEARSSVGLVRGASPGLDVSYSNTPPYVYGEWLFAHNGRVWPWDRRMVEALRGGIDGEGAEVRGLTDSEILGALWVGGIRRGRTAGDAAREMLRFVSEIVGERGGGFTASMVLQHATGLVAIRQAEPGRAPSLYSLSGEWAGESGIIVASEPLDSSSGWGEVPAGHLLRAEFGAVSLEKL